MKCTNIVLHTNLAKSIREGHSMGECGTEMTVVTDQIITLRGSGLPATLYQCHECKTIALQ